MAKGNEILIQISGDNKKIIAALNELNGKIEETKKKSSTFGDMFKAGAALVGIGAVASAIVDLGKKAFQGAVALEQQTIAFTTMLGSAEKAKNLITDIRELAAASPLRQQDVTQATQTYLAFGGALEKVIPTMRMLGDISLGDANKFQSLSLAFSQVMANGRLMGQDLLQLVNQGFNPLQIISEKTGKSMAELKTAMENGRISFKDVETAFKMATSEGGRFFGMMDVQSKSIGGKWSTLKDQTDMALTNMATKMKGAINIILDSFLTGTEATGFFSKTLMRLGEAFNTLISGIAIGYQWFVKTIRGIQSSVAMIQVDFYRNQLREIETAIKRTFNQTDAYIKEQDANGKKYFELQISRGVNFLSSEEKLFARRYELQQKINSGVDRALGLKDLELEALNKQTRAYQALYGQINEEEAKLKNLKNSKMGKDALAFDLVNTGALKKQEESLIAYYDFTEQMRQKELEQLRVQYETMLVEYGAIQAQKIEIDLIYTKKQKEIFDKYNNYVQTEVKNNAIDAADAFDQAFSNLIKKSLSDTLQGKDGFKNFGEEVKKIFADLVIDMTIMLAKAVAFKAIMASISGGTSTLTGAASLGSILQNLVFEKGRLPVYEKGRLPVLASGYIPADHFAAYIGTKEAVIDAQTTKANYGLIKYMMENPGQSIQNTSQITYNVPITGNVMTDEFVEKTLMQKLENIARRQGKVVFSKV